MQQKKVALVRKVLWGAGSLLVLLGGMYYGGPSRREAAAEEQGGTEPPVYQFWAHFLSILPQESGKWVGDYAQDPLHQPAFLALVYQLNRDLYNVKSPRGGWRYRCLAEVLAEGGLKPDAAALRSPDPEVVQQELNRLDPGFRYQVTATLKDQAPLGELMMGGARTKPVSMEFEGKPINVPEAPIEVPEAQVVYDVTVVLRIEKVYADGYALMQKAAVVTGGGEAQRGKTPLIEKKIGEAFNIISCPVAVRDFSLYVPDSTLDEVVVPGYLILATVEPLGDHPGGQGGTEVRGQG